MADYSYHDAVRRYGVGNVEKVLTERNQEPDPDLFMVFVKPGVRYRKAVMPHSEVLMHMGIAGKPMDFEIVAGKYAPTVQLYRPGTDERFSAPVMYGEAGVYYKATNFHKRHQWEAGGYYYFYPNFPPAAKTEAAAVDII